MNLIEVDESNVALLYEAHHDVYKALPFYLLSTYEAYKSDLLHGVKDGEAQFHELKTYVVESKQKILGWIQFGQPHIYIDTSGCKLTLPSIGVIRNFYFDKDCPDVGRQLLKQAQLYFDLKEFKQSDAFNHDLGAAFHAYHGKLHESQRYIENLLFEFGYQVEHENIYYSKPLDHTEMSENGQLSVQRSKGEHDQLDLFDLLINEVKIGQCKIRYFESSQLAYMKTIWLEPGYTHNGYGTEFMKLICRRLSQLGYEKLDLDTAHLNVIAQKYYEKNGFTHCGVTRSYVLVKED